MNADTLVTVAAPVSDADAPVVEGFVDEVSRVLQENYRYYEILLVDNGASLLGGVTDQIEALQKRTPNIRHIKLSRAYEEEIVFSAALDHGIGDFVVLMDLNRDPPSLIPQLVETCASGHDAVIGSYDKRRETGWLDRLGSRLFYRLSTAMTGYRIDPQAGNFRVLSRRLVNSITRIKSKNRYIKYLMEYVGYSHASVQYKRINRSGRPARRGLLQSLGLAVSVIVSNSDRPLRFVSLLGLGAAFLNLLYGVFVIVVTALQNVLQGVSVAQGWASTNLFTAGMFFLLFLMLAVLAEYVLKILNESRERPLYHVAYETTSTVVEEQRDRVNVV